MYSVIFTALVAVLGLTGSAMANNPARASYYDVSGLGENNMNGKSAYTACGWQSANREPVVAVSYKMFDKYNVFINSQRKNYLCGTDKPNKAPSAIWIWGNGKGPVKAYIGDRMEDNSRGENDLDLSPSLFKQLSPSGTFDEGIINVEWSWA
jgi:expansin (peptidoglycan-binding protein)